MSEAEFDSYLSLLSKFLRLRSRQRADLADELRDHLDSRLDELLAQGKTREQAVQVALEEFGDAAALATEFSRLASRRTRRIVMRCTAASAAVVAAVVLISLAVAPPGPNGPGPQHLAAQQDPSKGMPADAGNSAAGGIESSAMMQGMMAMTAGGTAAPAPSVEQQAVAALDEKLGRVLEHVDYDGVPLREVVGHVAEQIDADVLFDEKAITDGGLNLDDPITLKLARTRVSARTVLGFLLNPLDLALVNRAGVMYVTTRDMAGELLVTRVYNVRDLLEGATTHAAEGGSSGGMGGLGGMGMGGGGFYSVSDAAAALTLAAAGQLAGGAGAGAEGNGGAGGMMGGYGGMGGGMMAATPRLTGAAGELVETIRRVTPGPWLDTDGSGGTVTLFNGLLVVRQTEENHAEIQRLLDALREAGRGQPGGSVTVPKVDAPTPPAQDAPKAAAQARRPTREEFEHDLSKLNLTDEAREMLVAVFRHSAGRRTLNRTELLGELAKEREDQGPVRKALEALNIKPAEFVSDAGNVWNPTADMESVAPYLQKVAELARGEPIAPRHLMLALLDEAHDSVREFLKMRHISPDELREQLAADAKAPDTRAETSTGDPGQSAATKAFRGAVVRISVQGDGAPNLGSGTIIGSRDGKALVLTCWHHFRDRERGPISVEFSPIGGLKVADDGARLVTADMKADLALLEANAPGHLPAAPVAVPGTMPKPGDRVYSVSYPAGAALPVVQTHTVVRINPYEGPSTIACTDMPTVGESGGGLFDPAGRLIGVCIAAEREKQVGVYAGLKEVRALLKQAGVLEGGDAASAGLTHPKTGEPAAGTPAEQPNAARPISSPLGMKFSPVTEQEWSLLRWWAGKEFEFHPGDAARVIEVEPKGFAAASGVQPGDLITAVQVRGGDFHGARPSVTDLLSHKADAFELSVLRTRNGQFITVGIPINAKAGESAPGTLGPASAEKGLGARFDDFHPTAAMRRLFLGTLESDKPGIGEGSLLLDLADAAGPAQQVFQKEGVNRQALIDAWNRGGFRNRPIGDLYTLLDAAQAAARDDGSGTFDSGHLLVVLLNADDGALRDLLARTGINAEQLKGRIKEARGRMTPEERHPLQTAPAGRQASPPGTPAAEGARLDWPSLGLRTEVVKAPE
jgi:S1-C subfamily serine protease